MRKEKLNIDPRNFVERFYQWGVNEASTPFPSMANFLAGIVFVFGGLPLPGTIFIIFGLWWLDRHLVYRIMLRKI